MSAVAITTRAKRSFPVVDTLQHYTAAALTAATAKNSWIVPFDCRILDVIVNSGAAGSGGTSTIIDINVNGTSIYTTQGNRPTLLLADTGMYTEAAEPEIVRIVGGSIVTYDVDQITTTGPTLTTVCIVLGLPA